MFPRIIAGGDSIIFFAQKEAGVIIREKAIIQQRLSFQILGLVIPACIHSVCLVPHFMRVTVGASFCVYPEPNPLIFSTGFSLWGPVTEWTDLPIVGTSLYLAVVFIKSGSRQTCQTSVPRHPPPLGADARQLLHVAYRGWVTSVQFIFILSIKSTFALLNF